MNAFDLFSPSTGLARDAAALAVNVLIQSTVVILVGLLAARLLRIQGAAVQ